MGIIARQGIKNNIITYIGVIIGFANIVILQPLVLQPEELGLLRLMLSVATLFASIYPLGVNSFTMKYFPYFRNKEEGHGGFLGFVILSSTLLYLVGAWVFYLYKPLIILHYAQSKLFIDEFNYIFAFAYFIGIFQALTSYSISIFKTTVPSFLNDIIMRVISVSCIGLYYIKFISFDTVVVVHVFAYLLLIFILLFYIFKTDSFRLTINWKIFKRIPMKGAIGFSLMMWLTSLASISLRNIDAVLVGSFLGLSAVGVYATAVAIVALIDVPGSALSKIIMPKIADAFRFQNIDYVKKVYQLSVKVGVFSGSFLFLLIYVNAYDMMNLLPKKYIDGEWVIKLLAIGGFINMISGLNINIIQYSEKYKFVLWSLFILAVFSGVSDLVLIPRFGLIGAASSTCLSIIGLNVAAFSHLYREYKIQPIGLHDFYVIGLTICIAFIDYHLPKIPNSYIAIISKSSILAVLFLVIGLKMNLQQLIKGVNL